MVVEEIKAEDLNARIEYKNACVIGAYLEGKLKPADDSIIQKLKGVTK